MKHFFLMWAMLMTASFLLVSCGDSTAKKDEVQKNSIGMEFVKIPAGSFMMGSPTSEKDRDDWEVQHQVTISKEFYMGKYEVTQSQWKAIMGSLPSNCEYGSLSDEFVGDNKPIVCVSWEDAQEFIKKLNAKGEGTYRCPRKPNGNMLVGRERQGIMQAIWIRWGGMKKTLVATLIQLG